MNHPAPDRLTTAAPLRLASVALVLAVLATILGIIAAGDNVLRADVTVLEDIQDLDGPGVETAVTVSNAVFSTVGAIALAIMFYIATRVLRRPELALLLWIALGFRLVGLVLKPIFDSPRPGIEYQPDPSLVPETLGYPSGHSMTAAIITGVLVLAVYALDTPRWSRWLAVAAAAVLTACSMFARIWIGAHWPSDTLGGIMYGFSFVVLTAILADVIASRRASRAQTRV